MTSNSLTPPSPITSSDAPTNGKPRRTHGMRTGGGADLPFLNFIPWGVRLVYRFTNKPKAKVPGCGRKLGRRSVWRVKTKQQSNSPDISRNKLCKIVKICCLGRMRYGIKACSYSSSTKRMEYLPCARVVEHEGTFKRKPKTNIFSRRFPSSDVKAETLPEKFSCRLARHHSRTLICDRLSVGVTWVCVWGVWSQTWHCVWLYISIYSHSWEWWTAPNNPCSEGRIRRSYGWCGDDIKSLTKHIHIF